MGSGAKAEILITPEEAKKDVKNVYKLLLKVLPKVISRLKDKEIWLPLSTVARIDLHGHLDAPRHALLKFQVYHFLKRANNYRKLYFEINERSRTAFDKEMKAEGSYQPQMKEYRSLTTNLPGALVKGEGKAWIYSYDTYLTDIRYPSPKKDVIPMTGAEMFRSIESMVKWELVELERYRKISIKFAKVLKEDARKAAGNPTEPYREWRKETEDHRDPEDRFYFKHRYKSKDIRGEVEA
jgi:hypothetical protein